MARRKKGQKLVTDSSTDRRTILKVSAGTLAAGVGVAGCVGGDDDDDDDDGTDPGTDDDNGDDEYPTQPITVIVPWGAGGGSDTNFRTLQPDFEDEIGTSTNVDNRPGAGGREGMNVLSDQDADGYSIAFTSIPSAVLGATLHDTRYNVDDLNMAGVSASQFMGWATRGGRFSDFAEFRSYMESEDFLFGSAAAGSTAHFSALAGMDAMGVPFENASHVPFDGTEDSAVAVGSGDIDAAYVTAGAVQGLVEDGEIDIHYINRPDQDPIYPDATTVADLDVDVPVLGLTFGIFTPGDVAQDRVNTIGDAVVAAAQGDEYTTFAEEQGLEIIAAGGDDAQDILDEFAGWAADYQDLIDRLEG